MVYSDADLKGAVEAARSFILKECKEADSNQMKLAELTKLTAQEFYERVLAHARRR